MQKKYNLKLIISNILLMVIIATTLNGCAWVKAVLSAVGSHSNSGTSVQGNTLHAGKKETNATGTDYTNVGKVNHHYMRQTGDYVLRGVGCVGLLVLFGFIIVRFFKFFRRIIELNHRK